MAHVESALGVESAADELVALEDGVALLHLGASKQAAQQASSDSEEAPIEREDVPLIATASAGADVFNAESELVGAGDAAPTTAAAAAEQAPESTGMIAPYWSLLRSNTQYRLLFLSAVVSMLGDWVNYVGTLTTLGQLGGKAQGTLVSVYLILRRLPPLLLLPLVGWMADTFDRRSLMIGADVFRALVVGLLMLCTALPVGRLTVPALLCLVFLLFSGSAAFDPARAAIVPDVVARTQIATANLLDSSVRFSFLFIGSALGGLITAMWGVQVDYAIDVVTFGISALLLLGVRRRKASDRHRAPLSAAAGLAKGMRDVREGFSYATRNRYLLAMSLLRASTASGGALNVCSVVWAQSVFRMRGDKSGALTLGAMYMVLGLTGALWPVVFRRFTPPGDRAREASFVLALAIMGVTTFAFAFASNLFWFLVWTGLQSVGISVGQTNTLSVIQERVPTEIRGRVVAFAIASFTGLYTLAVLSTGLLLDAAGWSVRGVLLLTAAYNCAIALGWGAYFGRWSHRDAALV